MTAIALNFFGQIYHPATTKLRNAICAAANETIAGPNQQPVYRYDALFLLISSSGGALEDGFSLYSLLKTQRLPVTTVNMGQIASIANVPFLAGTHRIACPHSYFHFHNFDWNYPAAHQMTRQQFTDHTQLLDIARNKKKALLKEHTTLTDADFEALKLLDDPIIQSADFALEKGIIHEIGVPSLPAGTPILNVDY